jgi:5-methylcytosine-specific restriction endonuclease McrA
MEARWRKYSREVLEEAVSHSTSVMGVIRYLGLVQAGGTHAHLSRMIKRFDLDTSHFVRYRNGAHRLRLSAEQILVQRLPGSPRTKPPLLRRALLEIGRPHECTGCGNDGTWLGQPLTLTIDHIDGDFLHNRAENLRFLCPNCHAQTANYAGRSRTKYARVPPANAIQ